jgi:hypothetical protein
MPLAKWEIPDSQKVLLDTTPNNIKGDRLKRALEELEMNATYQRLDGCADDVNLLNENINATNKKQILTATSNKIYLDKNYRTEN